MSAYYWVTPLYILLAACDDQDDLWSGGSGWLIGLLVGILLLVLIVGATKRNRRKR